MTLSKIVVLFCVVFLLTPASTFAQADFFQKGESGVGFLAGYAEGGNSSTIQRTALVTLAGMIDFGVFTNTISRKESSYSIGATGFHLGIYPLRADTSKNIKINLGMFAEYTSISGEDIGIVGISIFKRSSNVNSFFSQSKFSIIKVLYLSSSGKPSTMAYQIDFTLGWLQKFSIITVTPSILKGENATIIGFTAGLAIRFDSSN